MITDARSLRKLVGIHADLVEIAHIAFARSEVPFVVTEGLRTEARQRELMAAGASKTMRSRHLTGHAIDVAAKVGDEIRWDWPLYARIAEAFKSAASDRGIAVEWGGDWKSFRDGPHFQLPWKLYP